MGQVLMIGGGNGADLDAITADAYDVRDGKVIVDRDGESITGNMPDHSSKGDLGGINSDHPNIPIHKGTYGQFCTPTESSERLFAVRPDKGYWNGNTYVAAPALTKTVTPSTTQQTVSAYAESGSVLEKVIVEAIPNQKNYGFGGFGKGDDYYAINCIPEGYYCNLGGGNWEPEARISKTTLRTYLGINPEKFLATKEIAEIKGSIPDNTTRTSNGNVVGVSSAYPDAPVRYGELPHVITNTDGVMRFCICPPKGYYQGGKSSYVCCDLTDLMKCIKIKQLACNATSGSCIGNDSDPEEAKFIMPSDGTVYYNGISGSVASSGNNGANRKTWCEIYKNNVLVDSRNINESNDYAVRTTMINKSFSAKKGDVIRLFADTNGGILAISHIDATILYF